VCSELIGDLKGRGRCDVIRDFARQYPIRVFSELFGLPFERKEEFRDHDETFLHDSERQAAAWSAIRAIVGEQLEAKRLSPKDDLLSAIANASINGRLIDTHSAINLASTVFVGGLDTLPSNIGWSFRYLANHPEARRRIISEPSVMPRVVEEFLRMWTVTEKPSRKATRDVKFKGAHMRAGDRIKVLLALANHDSAEFEARSRPTSTARSTATLPSRRDPTRAWARTSPPRARGGARGVARAHTRLPDRPRHGVDLRWRRRVRHRLPAPRVGVLTGSFHRDD